MTTVCEAAGFFVLRTPLLPFNELSAFGAGLTAATSPAEALAPAVERDRDILRRRLRACWSRPEVAEAILVASPSLASSVPVWLQSPDSERGQKIERALVRYLARMAGRPTPFGLFAGCSVGAIADQTRLLVEDRARYRRRTRLDADYLGQLCEALLRDSQVRATATYVPSSSLYRAAGRWRQVEARPSASGRGRSYHLVALEDSPALETVLARAQGGARLATLATALLDDARLGAVTPAEAQEFVTELVEAQLLVPELGPRVTGPEPTTDLVAQLSAVAPVAASTIGRAQRMLEELDAAPIGADPERYGEVAACLAALPVEPELARLFQVDLVKPAPHASLGRAPVADLVRAVHALRRLAVPASDRLLARFRDAFVSRYERQWVPLTEALDHAAAAGLDAIDVAAATAAPLLAGLDFPATDGDAGDGLGARERWLLAKVEGAQRQGVDELVLDEDELAAQAFGRPAPLPKSFAILATLAAGSDEALARGDYRLLLQGLNGPSGANLLGRFCHGDSHLTGLVRAHLRAEESSQPHAIFAEIVHLPEGRTGNILWRPLLRQHEIVYLGRSGAPAAQQLTIDDLLVSVVDDQVVLRSRRHGRAIIPRLTAAHAFTRRTNLPIYRFLCALQQQGYAPLGFDWGALAACARLPRVRIGRVVVSPGRWRIGADELAPLGALDGAAPRYAAVQALRARHRLPRWVAVVDGDQSLPVDLDNVLFVDTFVQLAGARREVVLEELFAPEQQCARGPEGAFVHELVIPMLARSAGDQPPPPMAVPSPLALPRSRPPGSDWLYAKIYCADDGADRLLRERVAPLVERSQASGALDGWFFVRFADPWRHLRLRLHGDAERLQREVQPLVTAALADAMREGLAWRIQLDTYERELERYGGAAAMELCEQLFCADSAAVLHMLDELHGDAGADLRWRLTLRGMDQLLDDLDFDTAGKLELVTQLRATFAREQRIDAAFERQLGWRFRQERAALEQLLDPTHRHHDALTPGLAALARRSERIRPIGASLRTQAAAGRLTRSLPQLAASFLHMHVNRMSQGAARAQELVLQDFLARLYEGQLARSQRRPSHR